MKRWIPWITALAIAGILVWSLVYLRKLHPLGVLATKLNNDQLAGIAIRLKGAKLVGRSGGRKIWSFEARTIDVSKNRRLTTFRDITRGSLLQDGRQIASLSAGEVVYNTYTKNVVIPGSAELRLENGPALKIRNALWDARQSRLICKGGVDATIAGSTLHGERMTVYPEKKELTIQKVRGTIRVE